MSATEKMPTIVKALLFFLPELVLCTSIWFQPQLLEVFMMSLANHVFAACSLCLASKQFLLSSSILFICLIAHLVRFLAFHLKGNFLLENHHPALKEILISLLTLTTYAVFLIGALNTPSKTGKASISIIDVVGASVVALAFIVIMNFAFSTLMNKEK